VSVGMLLDPAHLIQQPALVAVTLAIILVGKPLAALAIMLALRYPLPVALSVSVALAQIGEFSFILGTLGRELNLLTASATHTLVAAAIVSITVNPMAYRLVELVERRRTGHVSAARPDHRQQQPSPPPASEPRHRAVIIGYGPTGRAITRLLQENGVSCTGIELNLDAVRRLKEEGLDAVYGDATHRDTLLKAGVADADTLILSSAGMRADAEVIRTARELNLRIRILARASYLRDIPALRNAGADRVFTGEAEVALAFTEAVLRELGATPEQIDRERDRVHGDLFGR